MHNYNYMTPPLPLQIPYLLLVHLPLALVAVWLLSNLGSSSTPAMSLFSPSTTSASSSGANSVSSSRANSSPFVSTWQSTKSPILGSTFNTSSTSTGFYFGASSSSFSPTSSAPMVFGSTTRDSSNPIFPFSTTSFLPSSSTQTVFGNTMTSPFAASPGYNDQMNTEDSMDVDPVQSSTPAAAPVFGQSPLPPSPQGFMFPSPAIPFQVGGQQNHAAPQYSSLFQAFDSLEFNSGSFILGNGGHDKSGRKIVKLKRNRNRKR